MTLKGTQRLLYVYAGLAIDARKRGDKDREEHYIKLFDKVKADYEAWLLGR